MVEGAREAVEGRAGRVRGIGWSLSIRTVRGEKQTKY